MHIKETENISNLTWKHTSNIKILSSNLSNLSLCWILMKSNAANSAAICRRIFYTTDIVMRYNHHQARSVNRPSRANTYRRSVIDSDTLWKYRMRKGAKGREGKEGYRKLQREKEKEKQKRERNEGRAGLLAWDESA